MDYDKFQNWGLVLFGVGVFFFCGLQSLLMHEPSAAWVCFVGAVLTVDIGIVQIHIRGVV